MANTSVLMGSPTRPPLPPHLDQNLPLSERIELQKLLADERMRSEQHKMNYQQLKAEHAQLQERFMNVQQDLKATLEESKIVQEKYKGLYEQTQQELREKQVKIIDLKTQVLTPQRLEMIRQQVIADVEKPFKEKLHSQEKQIEDYRNSYNKLRYEFSFLKSEYEHEKMQHQQAFEELHKHKGMEITHLRNEKEMLATKMQVEFGYDSEQNRVLQRENIQLHQKVRDLITELEEVQAQREQHGIESEHQTRLQAKQLTEQTANVKSLEAERLSLKKQMDSLKKDVTEAEEMRSVLSSRVHELERDNLLLKNKVEETVHASKLELADLKMEMLKQRGDLERERDKMVNVSKNVESQLELAKHTIDQQAQALIDKEREAVHRVQTVREEELQRITQTENEKLELETKLQAMERSKIDEEAQRQAEKDKIEERMQTAIEARDASERELLVLRTKMQQQQLMKEEMERERGDNSMLRSQVSSLQLEINNLYENERSISDKNMKLHNQVELLRSEMKTTKEQMNKCNENNDKILARYRASWEEEREQLDQRRQELETKLGYFSTKLSKAATIHLKYKKKCSKSIRYLKKKLEISEAQREQLELEKKSLENAVPQEVHKRLHWQLKDLQRRHNEFRKLIYATSTSMSIGDLTFASMINPNPNNPVLQSDNVNLQEHQHQNELQLLRQRLDILDSFQKEQLEELQDIVNSTPIHRSFEDREEKL